MVLLVFEMMVPHNTRKLHVTVAFSMLVIRRQCFEFLIFSNFENLPLAPPSSVNECTRACVSLQVVVSHVLSN